MFMGSGDEGAGPSPTFSCPRPPICQLSKETLQGQQRLTLAETHVADTVSHRCFANMNQLQKKGIAITGVWPPRANRLACDLTEALLFLFEPNSEYIPQRHTMLLLCHMTAQTKT